jgi:hypothetical protein
VDQTIAKNVTSTEIRRQNMHYGEAVTQQTIKVASTHNLIKGNNTYRTPPIRAPPLVPNINGHTTTFHNTLQQQRSYADVTKNHEHQAEDIAIMLKRNFFEEFKGLFTQLLQQNSMMLNMLTTLIKKPH